MKKVLMAVALTAFIGSYSNATYAQDGDKKTTKTVKHACCSKDKKNSCSKDTKNTSTQDTNKSNTSDAKKSCCSKDKKKSCDKKK